MPQNTCGIAYIFTYTPGSILNLRLLFKANQLGSAKYIVRLNADAVSWPPALRAVRRAAFLNPVCHAAFYLLPARFRI